MKRQELISAIRNIKTEYGDNPLYARKTFGLGHRGPYISIGDDKDKYHLAEIDDTVTGNFNIAGSNAFIVGREQLSEDNLEQVAALIMEYSFTPLSEREVEKRYLYKFPFHATGIAEKGGGYVLRIPPDELAIDEAPLEFVMTDAEYHFTDKQVERYEDKQRALFETCIKIEVK